MKLVIQIPCYNEEKTLPSVINDLPKQIEGIDEVEYLVINDGSSDRTCQIAKELGAYVIDIYPNKGLANAFNEGIKQALAMNADIIVNTDGDNQYCGQDVINLVKPIFTGEADFVIGVRPISDTKEFSVLKKILQKFGSFVVGVLSGIRVQDAPSGFRAFSKKAAKQMHVESNYSYTIETIFIAKSKNLKVKNVDIRTNQSTRKSRLFKSMANYILRQGIIILKMFIKHRILKK